MKIFTQFHFEINPNFLNEKQIKELRLLPKGQVQLEVGIQTVHNKTLANINRGGSWGKTKRALDKLEPIYTDVHLHYDMIVGLPGESLKDIRDSFNKIIRTLPHHFQVGFLKVLPGTQISNEIDKWGYKYQEQVPYRVLSTNKLSFENLCVAELAELAVDLIYNSKIMPLFIRNIINYCDDPFELFINIGTSFIINHINKLSSNKKKLFELTKELFLSKYATDENKEEYMDILRYDWFRSSTTTHDYPPFLDADHCDKFKEDIYKDFKDAWKKLHQNSPPPERESRDMDKYSGKRLQKLKNAVFYATKDKVKSKRLVSSYDGVVKVNDKLYYINKQHKDFIMYISDICINENEGPRHP